MRVSRLVASLFVTGASLAAGCPSSNTGNLTRAEYDAQFVPALCDAVEACAGATVSQVFLAAAGGCEAGFGAGWENAVVPAMDMAIARGTVTYDAAAARACLDALRANPCGFNANGPAAIACQRVFVGSQPAGGPCSLNEECGVEQFCSITTACPGTCQARRTSGQDCSEDRHCAAGLACQDGMCTAPPREGAGCTELGDCALGLLCASGQCRPVDDVLVGAEGTSCNLQMGPLCRDGLSCVVDMVSVAGATFVCRMPAAAGGTCRLGIPTQCPVGFACVGTDPMRADFEGTCEPVPSTEDAPCDALSGCAAGLRCDDGNCVRVRDNGEACETSSQCASGQCNGGTCVAPMLCGT
jgi:hypothetical protein